MALKDSKFIGEVMFQIQNLVCSKDKEVELPLSDKEGRPTTDNGFINISYEEVASSTNQELKLVISPFSGNFVEQRDYFIYVMKQKLNQPDAWVPVVRTERLSYSEALAPWKEINLPVDCLMPSKRSDFHVNDIPIRLNVNQYERNGSHLVLGNVTTTLGELINGDKLLAFNDTINNSSYTLKINKCQLIRTPSFLDYINNGCETSLVIGVDFTGSNMDTYRGFNLHNTDYNQNQYYRAIYSVASILLNFDSDKQVPLFGFGAMINESYYNQVSH